MYSYDCIHLYTSIHLYMYTCIVYTCIVNGRLLKVPIRNIKLIVLCCVNGVTCETTFISVFLNPGHPCPIPPARNQNTYTTGWKKNYATVLADFFPPWWEKTSTSIRDSFQNMPCSPCYICCWNRTHTRFSLQRTYFENLRTIWLLVCKIVQQTNKNT